MGVFEVVEGDYCPTADLFFQKIGNSIPILPDQHYDPDFLPSGPLAVSHTHGVVFIAHSYGFCVARTKDVLDASTRLKSRGSVLDVCLVNVNTLLDDFRVLILALSPENSTLAVASFSCDINFFSVASLLQQNQAPCFSYRLNSQHSVQDLKWRKASKNEYIVLSRQGELHVGAVGSPLTSVLKNVDAADWSPNGLHVAVSSEKKIMFFSSSFIEESRIAIPVNSWTANSNDTPLMKVDSLSWIRDDSVIVGFSHQIDGEEEESYFVHVITIKKGRNTKVDWDFVVTSFYDMFLNVVDKINPNASGPYLQLDYLKPRQLAVAIHKKNIDQHIVLLSWSAEEGHSNVYAIELAQDSWLPRIELQGNDDHNLVLGLCIDEVSIYGTIKINAENEENKELSPDCVLICITLEGKLVMFHVASTNQVSTPRLVNSPDDRRQDVLEEVNDECKEYDVSFGSGEETSELSVVEQHPDKLQDILSSDNNVQSRNKPLEYVASQSIIPVNLEHVDISDSNRGHGIFSPIDFHGGNFESKHGSLARRVQTPKQKSLHMEPDIDSLPSISIQPLLSLQESLNPYGNLSDSSKDSYKALAKSNSERSVSSQLTSIQMMTEELDTLMQGIEKAGGFEDTCKKLHYIATEKLEKEMNNLFKKCKISKTMIDLQLDKIQGILNKTVQIVAKKSYLDDIIKQSSDIRYWELWDRQNLTSEFDLKRKQILKLDQDITNQIIRLEKHLNNLEFKKFGEQGGEQTNRRFQLSPEPARFVRPLPSIQNTAHSQLSAAEQLSERLSKQIALLKIESPVQQRSTKMELFETVGIQHDTSFSTPNKTSGLFSFKDPHTSRSNTEKQSPWRSQLRETKFTDSESRRRESLNQTWASFSPTKTTVKRIPFSNESSSYNNSSAQLERLDLNSSIMKAEDNKSQKLGSAKHFSSIEQEIKYPRTPSNSHSSGFSFPDSCLISKESVDVSSCSADEKLYATLTSSKNDTTTKFHQSRASDLTFVVENKIKMPAVMKLAESLQTNLNAKEKLNLPAFTPVHSSSTTLLPHDIVAAPDNCKRESIDFMPSSMPPFLSSFPDASSKQPLICAPTPALAVASSSSSLSTTKFAENPELTVSISSVSPMKFASHSCHVQTLERSSTCLPTTETPVCRSLFTHLPTTEQTDVVAGSSLAVTSATHSDISPVNINSLTTESSSCSLPEQTKEVVEKPDDDRDSPTSALTMDSQSSQIRSELDPLPVSASSVDCIEISFDKHSEVVPDNVLPAVVTESGSTAQFSVVALPSQSFGINEKSENLMDAVGAIDDMEEEAPEDGQVDMLSLSNLIGGFGTAATSPPRPVTNPFGPSFSNITSTGASSAVAMQVHGELFRPAAFNIPTAVPTLTSQPTSAANFGAGNFGKPAGSSAFGQPSKLGVGQQALGSVLGTFGQSRQIGAGFSGSGFASPSTFGTGFGNTNPASGYSSSALSTGFGSSTAGGFAAMASVDRGFASVAPGGVYAAASSSGGGFGTSMAGGGFGSFSKQQGSGGFFAFSGNTGSLPHGGNPAEKPDDRFTQMRK